MIYAVLTILLVMFIIGIIAYYVGFENGYKEARSELGRFHK